MKDEAAASATGAKLLVCLEALAQSAQGLSVSEVAAATGISRPAASRLLDTLNAAGYISRDNDRRYRLSLRLFEVGSRAVETLTPIAAARREMVGLAEQLERDVFLMVLEGLETVVVERADWINGRAVLKPYPSRAPWHASASGRVQAAYLSPHRLDELLGVLGEGSAETEERLIHVKQKGFDTQPTRQQQERIGLSAAILDHSGCAVAAIGAYFWSHELDAASGDEFRAAVLDSASRISHDLGYRNSGQEAVI